MKPVYCDTNYFSRKRRIFVISPLSASVLSLALFQMYYLYLPISPISLLHNGKAQRIAMHTLGRVSAARYGPVNYCVSICSLHHEIFSLG
jgi:hypothetical protein